MVFRYMSSISSFSYCSSSFSEMYISRSLRFTVMSLISSDRMVLRTNCWVMVDAPSSAPPSRLLTTARPTPMRSTPLWE